VATQDEAAVEAQEEILSVGLNRVQALAVEALRQVEELGPRMRRLHLEHIAHERLQGPGDAG
jgi:hypothetical protein